RGGGGRRGRAGKDEGFGGGGGKEAAAEVKALLDHAPAAPAPLPPALKAALDAAAARKSSYVVFMNLVKAMGAVLGGADPQATDTGVLLDITFAGGDARTRIGVPSAHVRALVATFRNR